MNILVKSQNTFCRPTRLSRKLVPAFRKTNHIQKKHVIANPCKASFQDIATFQTVSYFVGKSVILFTMFYCSLNWWFYKTEREKEEEKNRNKD